MLSCGICWTFQNGLLVLLPHLMKRKRIMCKCDLIDGGELIEIVIDENENLN